MTGQVGNVAIRDGSGAQIPGGVQMYDISGVGSGRYIPMYVPSDLSGNAVDLTVPAQVVGSVASGSSDSGNPLKIGAVYHSALPTFTDGQRADLQVGSKGGLLVGVVANTTPSDSVANSNAAGLWLDGNGNQRYGLMMPMTFNGTSWDRKRKPNAVSRIASAAASVNATSAKAAAGDVWKAAGYNAKAAVVYLKLYNKASAPTVGTDAPFTTIALPASAAFNIDFAGLYMGTGIAYGFTTDAADNGTTALLAGDILGFSLIYA